MAALGALAAPFEAEPSAVDGNGVSSPLRAPDGAPAMAGRRMDTL